MGRPQVEIDEEKLAFFARVPSDYMTGEEIAWAMDISYSSLALYCKKTHGITFKEYREQKASVDKAIIYNGQLKLAKTGNATMLIWLGKQRLGQRDHSSHDVKQVTIDLSKDDIASQCTRIENLVKELQQCKTTEAQSSRSPQHSLPSELVGGLLGQRSLNLS